MRNRSVLLFYRRHKLLLAFLSAIIVQLPQYIDSIWSLSERASGGSTPVSASWLYWVTVPLGLGMLGTVYWLTRKSVLSDAEKSKITALMVSVNALDDMMSHNFDTLIVQRGRVSKYQSLLDGEGFTELWDKYSKQRAEINTISPELGELVRLLLMLLRTGYRYLLKDWRMNELSKFEKAIEEHIRTTEAVRKRIKRTIEKLVE